jgi:superfamily II DNA helicase RecQ
LVKEYEDIKDAIQQIFGYEPRSWQLTLAEKVLEGHDAIGLAGTGAGKSLVFAILAVAAELAEFQGLVLVVCPLKSLQNDQVSTVSPYKYFIKVWKIFHQHSYVQVRRFNEVQSVRLSSQEKEFKLSAIAVNEDNRDEKVFTQLEKGQHRLCYASPEILLRNSSFKKLFRLENFRRSLVAIVVDEAHVIESWKDDFRKDYGELETLRIIAGTEIPWLALTATCSTRTFEIIYKSLGMGGHRPFYGIDLGADRPNIAQWVRPMEYHELSKPASLVPFIYGKYASICCSCILLRKGKDCQSCCIELLGS